jgi:hypothetical protein
MQNRLELSDFVAAMKSLNTAKNIFMALIIVALLAQIAIFVLLNFTSVLTIEPNVSVSSSSQPASMPATAAALAAREIIIHYRTALEWSMSAAQFLALVAAVLNVLVIMYAAALSLVGGGRGIPPLFRAFCWSLVLLALMTPWQNILQGSKACGALSTFAKMESWYQHTRMFGNGLMDSWQFYARYLAYPAVAVLTWGIVIVKFASGYRRLVETTIEVLNPGSES